MKRDKSALVIAVIAAIITGLATVAPKIYDVITEPKALLAYSVTSSPDLDLPNGVQRIIAISIRNLGKKPLEHVKGRLSLNPGQIGAAQLIDALNIASIKSPTQQEVDISSDRMLPGDAISLSVMVNVPRSDVAALFNLRSDEVSGQQTSDTTAVKPNVELGLLSAVIAAGASFFIITAFLMIATRTGNVSRLFSLDADKADFIAYVAIRALGLEIPFTLSSRFKELTYRGAGDLFLAYGLHAADKTNAIKALKCLLLIEEILEVSVQAIQKNISLLQGREFTDAERTAFRKNAVKLHESTSLRKLVDDVAEGRLP